MMNNGTNTLWYRQGAVSWNEALPLGNGRLGAMVWFDPAKDVLNLNEDSLWSGYPVKEHGARDPQGAEARVERRLMAEDAAYRLCRRASGAVFALPKEAR